MWSVVSSLLVALLTLDLIHSPVYAEQTLIEYKEAISKQPTHFTVPQDLHKEVCLRAATWYIDYNDERLLNDLGGAEKLR